MQSFNKKRENFNNFYVGAVFLIKTDSVTPPHLHTTPAASKSYTNQLKKCQKIINYPETCILSKKVSKNYLNVLSFKNAKRSQTIPTISIYIKYNHQTSITKIIKSSNNHQTIIKHRFFLQMSCFRFSNVMNNTTIINLFSSNNSNIPNIVANMHQQIMKTITDRILKPKLIIKKPIVAHHTFFIALTFGKISYIIQYL